MVHVMKALRAATTALVALGAMLGAHAPAVASDAPGTATSVVRGTAGSAADGSRVTWWLPERADGRPAPVVVVLHGYGFLNPELYGATIAHLWRSGSAVIYPQYQRGGRGLLGDTDQNAFLRRAIDATEVALGRLGPDVDRRDLVVYGHSLGGLLGAA
jgi:dipeptidyl aminopeptidase/acylaminoacyl peptidase